MSFKHNNLTEEESNIFDWLINNPRTISDLYNKRSEELEETLKNEDPVWHEWILKEYYYNFIKDLAIDISYNLGYGADIIKEILDSNNVREYINDCVGTDDSSTNPL